MKNILTSETPLTDSLNSNEYNFVDNELQQSIGELHVFSIGALFNIFHGHKSDDTKAVKQLLFAIFAWPFLKTDSVRVFCAKHLSSFVERSASSLYRYLRKETINWRGISRGVAKTFYKTHNLHECCESVFVIDDSVKQRRGSRIEGSSKHFDHTEGRCVHGQQVMQLGLAHDGGFLPLDSQIYVGEKGRIGLQADFSDNRSAVARDYSVAVEKDKNEMMRTMLSRAQRAGFSAEYVAADSWFCNKGNICYCLSENLTAIMRMKAGTTKYRLQGRDLTLTQLYAICRRRMQKSSGISWKTTRVTVDLNLNDDQSEPHWTKIAIVFTAPKNGQNDQWAAFLSTELNLSNEKVLELYAHRWGIEVYFKEAKQNMGWLAEETPNYTVHYASLHLTAIRYILLSHLVLNTGSDNIAGMRDEVANGLENLSFMKSLWWLFKSMIWEVLDSFTSRIGYEVICELKAAITSEVEDVLKRALQIDQHYLETEKKALSLGISA